MLELEYGQTGRHEVNKLKNETPHKQFSIMLKTIKSNIWDLKDILY